MLNFLLNLIKEPLMVLAGVCLIELILRLIPSRRSSSLLRLLAKVIGKIPHLILKLDRLLPQNIKKR